MCGNPLPSPAPLPLVVDGTKVGKNHPRGTLSVPQVYSAGLSAIGTATLVSEVEHGMHGHCGHGQLS